VGYKIIVVFDCCALYICRINFFVIVVLLL